MPENAFEMMENLLKHKKERISSLFIPKQLLEYANQIPNDATEYVKFKDPERTLGQFNYEECAVWVHDWQDRE